MKKLLLACLVTATSIQATDLAEAWKQFSAYRVVSGAKAVVVGVGTYQAASLSYTGLKNLGNTISNTEPWTSLEKGKKIIRCSVFAGGMAYVVYKLGWDYFPVYARHALALK